MTNRLQQPQDIPVAAIVATEAPIYPSGVALERAGRSVRLLSALSALFGVILTIVFGFFNRLPQFRVPFELFGGVVFLVPGVLLPVSMWLVSRANRVGLHLAVITCLFQIAMACGLLVCQLIFSPVSLTPVLGNILWLLCLLLLGIDLIRGYPAMRAAELGSRRGFSVLPAEVRK